MQCRLEMSVHLLERPKIAFLGYFLVVKLQIFFANGALSLTSKDNMSDVPVLLYSQSRNIEYPTVIGWLPQRVYSSVQQCSLSGYHCECVQ